MGYDDVDDYAYRRQPLLPFGLTVTVTQCASDIELLSNQAKLIQVTV